MIPEMLKPGSSEALCKKGCAQCCYEVTGLLINEWPSIVNVLQLLSPDIKRTIFQQAIRNIFSAGLTPWEVYSIMSPHNLFNNRNLELEMKRRMLWRPEIPLLSLTPQAAEQSGNDVIRFMVSLAFDNKEESIQDWIKKVKDCLSSMIILPPGVDNDKMLMIIASASIYSAKTLLNQLSDRDSEEMFHRALRQKQREVDLVFNFLCTQDFTQNLEERHCPALNSKKECSIYSARPLMCRLVGSGFTPSHPELAGCADNLRNFIDTQEGFTSGIRAEEQLFNQNQPQGVPEEICPIEFFLVGKGSEYLPANYASYVESEPLFRKFMRAAKRRNLLCLCGSGKKAKHCHGSR